MKIAISLLPVSPGLYGLNLGLGATTGANFLGDCCWDTEILALPRDGVVSILADTCPVWSSGFHMVLITNQKHRMVNVGFSKTV